MVTLLLLRHAKSRWDEAGRADHDRGLAPRGVKAAATMGRHAAAEGWLPDLVLCSTAARTAATGTLFCEAAGITPAVKMCGAIYEADAGTLLDLLLQQSGGGTLMMIGHMPGIPDLAHELVGERDKKRLSGKFPTAALAVIAFKAADFAALRPGEGRLVAFVRPKDLG